jgi:hypothetical protein
MIQARVDYRQESPPLRQVVKGARSEGFGSVLDGEEPGTESVPRGQEKAGHSRGPPAHLLPWRTEILPYSAGGSWLRSGAMCEYAIPRVMEERHA